MLQFLNFSVMCELRSLQIFSNEIVRCKKNVRSGLFVSIRVQSAELLELLQAPHRKKLEKLRETSRHILKPAAHGEENAQQSGMNVILLSKILAMCG